jgi:hypothetical protein
MWRIAETLTVSTRNFAEEYRHNFERVANMSFRRAQKIAEIQMSEANLQGGQCSETKLLTSRFSADLLWSHQDSKDITRTRLPPEIDLVLEQDMQTSVRTTLDLLQIKCPKKMNRTENTSNARQ